MAQTGKKGPIQNLNDRLRSLFGPGGPGGPADSGQKKEGLPPKTHFTLWYLLFVFLLLFMLQQYFFSSVQRDNFV